MTIVATEDHLIDELRALFGSKLRTVDSLPGDWDADMLRKLLIAAPAVYIAFTGGPRRSDVPGAGIEGRWSFFAITAHASGSAARRRGDSQQIGAYEIIERLTARFDGHVVPDVGTLELTRLENLYSGTVDGKGVAIYAALFTLPMYFEPAGEDTGLDDFVTFHADYDLAPTDGAPEAADTVTLEQP